ncbi:hypothetical protein Tco_1556642 [Tanacetum coccineum]
MEDSILERYKENPHFKSFWMLLLSLHATLHFSSLQMFQKFTCINFRIQFTRMTLSTDSKWTKERDSNSLWKSLEISLRSSLEAQILWGMYHQKNVDYVKLLWEDFIYQIDNRAYKKQEKIPESGRTPRANKTYLGFATGATPPKKARKFKKLASPQITTVPRLLLLENHEMPFSKKKEKVDVTRGKGIELLSQVALKEDAYLKKFEGRGNDKDDNYNEQDSSDEDNDQANVSSESDQEENEEDIGDDEEEVKDEFVKTPSNDSDDEDETKITKKAEGDEDEEMDYTTSQLYDDVDIRLNEPVDTEKGFFRKIFPIQMQKSFLQWMFTSIMKYQASKLPHSLHTCSYLSVNLSPIISTVIPQSLPSFTPPPQQSTPTPPPTTKATNPQSALPNFASIFQFNNRVIALEKEVDELKKDPLHT